MKRYCALFDKYRDGELDADRRRAFESHLAECGHCRMQMTLLDNVTVALRCENIVPLDLAEQIARRAFHPEVFQEALPWDALLASWFRPRFAAAVLAAMMMALSLLWLMPGGTSVSAYTEYEKLLNEAESSDLAGRLLVHSDQELILQLADGGE